MNSSIMNTERLVPGKRLRNWHRRYGQGLSLRAFVRGLTVRTAATTGVDFGPPGALVARQWLASKGARP